MIQDIQPHVFSNTYAAELIPSPTDPVLHFSKGEPLASVENDLVRIPCFADYRRTPNTQFLFRIDDTPYFLATDDEVEVDETFSHTAVRPLRRLTTEPKHVLFAIYTAIQLDAWYRDNAFCGRCGSRTRPAADERAIDCTGCGRRIYPKVQPAVIIGVTNGDSLLITRYSDRPLSTHALVAGFNEIGETLEETVMREVHEETGLAVDNIRYYKSQPWGIASDVLSGFYCDVVGDPTPRIDPSELKEAVWVERSEIQGQPDNFSLTNEMMLTFRDGGEPR